MTPAELDASAATCVSVIREKVEETGLMAMGAMLLATYHHQRGPVPPTAVRLNLHASTRDHELVADLARAGAHLTRALYVLCFGHVHGRVVIAYERQGWRQVLSTPWEEGSRTLPELMAGEVPGVFERIWEPVTIHILHHGFALCGKPGVPGSWEPGHLWVGYTDSERGGYSAHEATCEGCVAKLSSLTH